MVANLGASKSATFWHYVGSRVGPNEPQGWFPCPKTWVLVGRNTRFGWGWNSTSRKSGAPLKVSAEVLLGTPPKHVIGPHFLARVKWRESSAWVEVPVGNSLGGLKVSAEVFAQTLTQVFSNCWFWAKVRTSVYNFRPRRWSSVLVRPLLFTLFLFPAARLSFPTGSSLTALFIIL